MPQCESLYHDVLTVANRATISEAVSTGSMDGCLEARLLLLGCLGPSCNVATNRVSIVNAAGGTCLMVISYSPQRKPRECR
jgi:hypothetical protein